MMGKNKKGPYQIVVLDRYAARAWLANGNNFQSWAAQAKVLGSSILKDYILSSWFLLEFSAQNLVLDLKYAK